MSKYDRLKKQNAVAFSNISNEVQKFGTIAEESRRVSDIAYRAGDIISELDKQFAESTQLNGKDIAFLFFAVALQSARWILLPSLDLDFSKTDKAERLTSAEGGQIEKKSVKEYLEKHSSDNVIGSKRFYTWKEIIMSPVPYDAMKGSERISIDGFESKGKGKRLYGVNHHTATWGHDPIMGWIVGPLNITARMITFRDMQTYHVAALGNADLVITNHTTNTKMIGKCIDSWQEDNKRLFASVAKQGMHFQSDKYTKNGLQIPLIDGDKAQKLLENGWNSAEVEKIIKKIGHNLGVVGAQAGWSILINQIIKAIHLLCYDENADGTIAQYEVRTRKILSYSNVIASSSNILYSVISKDLKKLDIGGISITLYRLVSDYRFIQKIKREFLENEWYSLVMGEEYDF